MSSSNYKGRKPADTYTIRRSTVREYHAYSVTIPTSIAAPLYDAGFRVRFSVTDDGILMTLVPTGKPDNHVSEERLATESLIARLTNGKEG